MGTLEEKQAVRDDPLIDVQEQDLIILSVDVASRLFPFGCVLRAPWATT